MWLPRLVYLSVLFISSLYYVMYPHWFAWYLWVLVLLFLPFDFLISLPGMRARQLALTSPRILELGAQGELVITALSLSSLPSGPLTTRVYEIGERGKFCHRILLSGGHGPRYGIDIDTSATDVIHFEVRRSWAHSLMGLTALPVFARYETAVTVLPAPIQPPNYDPLSSSALRLYPKPGGGFSEEHDLRPYRLGDPIKMMHWKLSAKHDTLIVREALAPLPQTRLINAPMWDTAYERDLVVGRLRWCSASLLEQAQPHFVRIGDQGKVAWIETPEDMDVFLYASLVGTEVPMTTFVPARFSWVLNIDAKRVAG